MSSPWRIRKRLVRNSSSQPQRTRIMKKKKTAMSQVTRSATTALSLSSTICADDGKMSLLRLLTYPASSPYNNVPSRRAISNNTRLQTAKIVNTRYQGRHLYSFEVAVAPPMWDFATPILSLPPPPMFYCKWMPIAGKIFFFVKVNN